MAGRVRAPVGIARSPGRLALARRHGWTGDPIVGAAFLGRVTEATDDRETNRLVAKAAALGGHWATVEAMGTDACQVARLALDWSRGVAPPSVQDVAARAIDIRDLDLRGFDVDQHSPATALVMTFDCCNPTRQPIVMRGVRMTRQPGEPMLHIYDLMLDVRDAQGAPATMRYEGRTFQGNLPATVGCAEFDVDEIVFDAVALPRPLRMQIMDGELLYAYYDGVGTVEELLRIALGMPF